jgi:hypothetical protein
VLRALDLGLNEQLKVGGLEEREQVLDRLDRDVDIEDQLRELEAVL